MSEGRVSDERLAEMVEGHRSDRMESIAVARELIAAREAREAPEECGICHELHLTRNPHPEAGAPPLAFGAVRECIPCRVKASRQAWERAATAERDLLALRRCLALTEAVAQAAREQRNLFRSHRLCDCWRCLEAGPALDAALAAYDAAKEASDG